MFKNEDIAASRGLKKVLDDGTFPLMAKEINAFSLVYRWVDGLESKIEAAIKDQEKIPKKEKTVKKKKKSKKKSKKNDEVFE